MHELFLAENICEIVRANVPDVRLVSKVVVECGPLSGVSRESLEYCFEAVARSMDMGGAVLDLRMLTAKATCPNCSKQFDIDSMWANCIFCGHAPVTVEGGGDLQVKEVEVEDLKDEGENV